MLPPGHRCAPLVPDDPAQDVQRRVRPHQGVPAFPVELPVHPVADHREGTVAAQRVPHAIAVLADVGHR